MTGPGADSAGPGSPPGPDTGLTPEEESLAPLLQLSGGLPDVVDTGPALARVVDALQAGSGPIAVDAERASGYRYSSRAYLVQLRRAGAGTALVDPIPLTELDALAEVLRGPEWVVHAASQDLPCLAELNLRPSSLFDTELAGRLLGYPRVGLGTLVETVLGFRMRKEHSAVDWSTRPLPPPWLEYAALDVEALVELRDALDAQLVEAGKKEWAAQEFTHVQTMLAPAPRAEPWRRTSGLHRVRSRRSLAAVRALWEARDTLAAQRDISPGRVIPDSAIVQAATALPRDRASLVKVPGFHGRGARRYAEVWVDAVRGALALSERDLPAAAARYDGPPPPRAWPERNPPAAARLAQARAAVQVIGERLQVPVENLLTPDYLRRVLWEPPVVPAGGDLRSAVGSALTALGARPWQVDLVGDEVAAAIEAHPDR